MSRHAELAARAEAHLATAEAGADDPHVAALCAMTAALLATRPSSLRSTRVTIDLKQYLADTKHDTSPAAAGARAVAAAMQSAQADLDEIDVDDCGFPTN